MPSVTNGKDGSINSKKKEAYGVSKYDGTFILHNTGSKQIKKPEYIRELHKFKTKCSQCQKSIQKVRSLLGEIKNITEKEVIGVCEHCKRATSLNKTCKRCEFIVSEYKSMHEKTRKERLQRFNIWLCKVNYLLKGIVEGEGMCKHRLNKDSEFERILHALKEPLRMQEPNIDSFSNLIEEKVMSLQSISENKEMLEELLSKMELEDKNSSSNSLLSALPFQEMCLCKCLKEKVGEIYGFVSKKMEDYAKSWEPMKDFGKTLRQEGHGNLMKILLDLCKGIPQEFDLNTDILKEIVETINTALRQGLTLNIVFKLINNLIELNKTLSDDLSQDLNTKVTQALIDDLNELLLLGSSKDLNHDLIIFLVDLSNFLTQKTCKALINKKALTDKKLMPKRSSTAVALKLANPKKTLSAGILDENHVQKISSDIRKGRMSPDELNKIIKELTNSYKLAAQEKSKTVNLELIKGLISYAKKELAVGLTNDQNAIRYTCKKPVTSNEVEVQKIYRDFTKNVSKNISKVLRSGYSAGKTVIKAVDHADNINKKRFDYEAGIAKTGTKSGKTSSNKTVVSLEKTMKKKVQERAVTNMGKYLFENYDTQISKSKVKRVKGKENLPPEDDKKYKYLKRQPRQKSKELQRDARELSASMLIKKHAKEEKFLLKKQKLLAKQAEKEKKRVEKLFMKDESKQERRLQSFSSRKEIAWNQKTEITIFGEPPEPPEDLEKEEGDPEPLPASPSARRLSKNRKLFNNGAIKYQLSNETFIRKGWTLVPVEKIMRKMNIYRMVPACSQNCWFDRHKELGELFYDTGQILAVINENGRGHLYYRNGSIALHYYDAQEAKIGQRYVVYSSGAEIVDGKIRPRTILALFDGLGNCVVYDLFGNIRLKYNQSEGVLLDSKIGPPSKWKWHSLNDPPHLQRLFVDTYLEERDSELERLTTATSDENQAARLAHSEMVALELDNVVKEKTFKLKQKFRPFQIRVKTLKLNDQFSLKILDQATIYLLYRDGATNLKLNLGLLLKSNEIIDTVNSDVGEVLTPYDVRPPKTESVDNIHKVLKSVRSHKS